ncbi:MoaD/ThiS family protein [Actinomyces urinae]|uniref:MoaD/ThiS family protein n=1 Tax=Actinomyces urinae TaxID=1689268 RepID=UPI0009F80D7E|nr:MoaD/ThiS family protein [Actinomyces urinae]
MATIRLFAGAAEAAGCSTIRVEPAPTVAGLLQQVSAGNDVLERVVSRSLLLAEGKKVLPTDSAESIDTLDVLPPFAGG